MTEQLRRLMQQNVDNKIQKEGSGTYVNYPKTITYAKNYMEWYI